MPWDPPGHGGLYRRIVFLVSRSHCAISSFGESFGHAGRRLLTPPLADIYR
jgi:hypothetical protein